MRAFFFSLFSLLFLVFCSFFLFHSLIFFKCVVFPDYNALRSLLILVILMWMCSMHASCDYYQAQRQFKQTNRQIRNEKQQICNTMGTKSVEWMLSFFDWKVHLLCVEHVATILLCMCVSVSNWSATNQWHVTRNHKTFGSWTPDKYGRRI